MSSSWVSDDDTVQYVTEDAPTPPPPPPPPLGQQLVVGAGLGAAAGLAFLGAETAVSGWLGIQAAAGVIPLIAVPMYAATGALFGLVAMLFRKDQGHWAAIGMCLVAAWLVSGHLTAITDADLGVRWMALPLLFALASLGGYFGIARNTDEATAGGIAVAVFLILATLLPLDSHYLLTVYEPLPVLMNVGVLIVAVAIAAMCGMILADGMIGMRILIGIGFVVCWLAAVPVLRPAYAPWPTALSDPGPPVVLVVVTGLRADAVGLYGAEPSHTPSIDEAGARGLVYADAVSASSWTLPATASLLTGRLPSHHHAGAHAERDHPLPSEPPVIPSVLGRQSYASAAITSSPVLKRPYGTGRGFGFYDDRTAPSEMPAALHPLARLGIDPLSWPKHRGAEELTDRAVSFIEAQQRTGWFLMVQYGDLLELSGLPDEDYAAAGVTRGSLRADYAAGVHYVDRQVGRLLAAVPEGAWVVVLADHGVELDERREADGPVSRDPQFGHTLFQELVHVPLVVVGPGLEPTWVERPVPTIDIAPSLAAVAGAKPSGMDGQVLYELRALLAADDEDLGPEPPPRVLVSEATMVGPEKKAARLDRYKLIQTQGAGGLLYDLQVDPVERSPIRQLDRDRQAIVRELEALLPPFPE